MYRRAACQYQTAATTVIGIIRPMLGLLPLATSAPFFRFQRSECSFETGGKVILTKGVRSEDRMSMGEVVDPTELYFAGSEVRS